MSRRAAEFAEVAHGFSLPQRRRRCLLHFTQRLAHGYLPGGSLRTLPRSSERAKACDSR